MLSTISNTTLPELTAILLARLGLLWLLVLISLLLPVGDTAFYAFMGVAFIITIPYALWLRSRLKTAQFAPLQFLVDLVLVTGLVYFTGGTDSHLTLLYPLVILSAGMAGTPRQAMQTAVLAAFVYSLLAALLANHWIVPYEPAGLYAHNAIRGLSPALNVLSFLLFGGTSIYISKQCSHSNVHRKELTQTAESLLAGIPAPALLIDHEGYILFANKPSCSMLETDFEQLAATLFSDLKTDGPHDIPKHFGPALYLKRGSSEPLPAAYQAGELQLLETALPGSNGRTNRTLPLTLIIFTDIRQALETEIQLRSTERITAAPQTAGETAHEIRTPLTAISASFSR